MNLQLLKTLFLLTLFLVFPEVVSAAEEVHVAVVGPMGGTSVAVGIQYKAGVSAALRSLPGGMLLDRPVVVSLYDDGCDAAIAEAVAQQIVENPPAVVIGHSCSGATIAAAPVYASHKVLQITPASTNPKVTGMGIGTIFRMIGRDDVQGELAARRIAERHAGQRVGVLYFPRAYSLTLSRTAMESLAKRGITPVVTVQAKSGETSYTDAIEQFLNHHVEVLYMVGGGLDSGIFMRQVRQMGAAFDVIGSDTLVSEVFQKTAGDAANGVPFTFPPEAVRLASAAQAAEAVRATGFEPAGYTLLAYAAIQVWIEGVERAQSFDTGNVAEAIHKAPVETILGTVSFDAQGDIATPFAPFAWYTWKDGRRVPLD
ncbi:MAG: branched-chain amino acid ABC transporter substrate-binding protein [Desulfovibrionaceae bacterium]